MNLLILDYKFAIGIRTHENVILLLSFTCMHFGYKT